MKPKQQRLFSPGNSKPKSSKHLVFAESNRVAAEIILRDLEKYGGETSLLVEWARKVMEKHAQRQ